MSTGRSHPTDVSRPSNPRVHPQGTISSLPQEQTSASRHEASTSITCNGQADTPQESGQRPLSRRRLVSAQNAHSGRGESGHLMVDPPSITADIACCTNPAAATVGNGARPPPPERGRRLLRPADRDSEHSLRPPVRQAGHQISDSPGAAEGFGHPCTRLRKPTPTLILSWSQVPEKVLRSRSV